LGQLSKAMRDAIDANARSKVFFAFAPGDADDLVHHVKPYFAADDLIHRDVYGMVCRLAIRGRNGEPFTLRARPAPPVWPGRAELLRAAARNCGPAAQRARQRTQQPADLDLLDANGSGDSGPILPPGGKP
jgi:hypothetical protein